MSTRLAIQAIARIVVITSGLVFAIVAPVHAEAPPSVVIVFDGSGSMWSKLGAGPGSRLAGARDAVKAALADQKKALAAGLISFGHRQQANCSDVQTIVPLDDGDNARVGTALDKLNPRGKGPFVQAVREAATLLKGVKGDRHILLLHDDPDNCQQDPCAAARDIAAADPGLRIHVVSIAMRSDDPGRPLCMARTTGGKALVSDTAADLTRDVADILSTITRPMGGTSAASAASLTAPPVKPAPSVAAQPTVVTAAPKPGAARTVPATGAPRLLLGARLTAGGPLLAAGARYRIATTDGQAAPISQAGTTDGGGAAPDVALPAGRYTVTVETGALTLAAPVDVKPEGGTELVFDLNAALLRLSGVVKRGGAVAPAALLTVRRAGADGAILWVGFGSTEGIVVPAGDIVVTAADGAAKAEQTLTAEAGKSYDVALPLEAGRLKLAAVARDGGPPLGDVVYRVLEDDPEATRGRKEVARSSAAAPDVMLTAGSYVVAASNGGAEVRERVIIRPGEEVAKIIVIGVSRVRFNVRSSLAAGATAPPVAYTFKRLDAEAPDITGSTDRTAIAAVNPGRYRLEIRVGEQNARLQQDVDIRPGVEIVVTQTIAAGRVDFAIPDRVAIAAGGDILWDLTTANGAPVWRSMQARPRLVLAPGTYTMTLEARGTRTSKRFDIAAGEARSEVVGE